MPALDEMVPSVELVHALMGFDAAGADLDALTAGIVGWERLASWATACQNELLAEAERLVTSPAYGGRCSDAIRWYPDHLGLVLNLAGGTVSHRIDQATRLVQDLPNVHAALKAGVITRRHAEVAAKSARVLDREVARAVDAAVMVDDSWRTPSQLETALARTILEVDAAGAAARNQAARTERDVRTRNEPDGLLSLYALLPAEQGQAVAKKIDAASRSSKAQNTPGDDRTLAQRRADVLVDLVLRDGVSDPTGTGAGAGAGSAAGTGAGAGAKGGPRLHGRRPEICVTVAQSTLMGADDAPAHLEGYGWIDAGTARRIAADPSSVWRRLIVDPVSGRLLDFGRETYRPPQDMTDYVIARDVTCTFLTCDLPAVLCDLDHLQDWAHGGITAADDNAPACRRHHRLKHDGGWTHQRDRDTGESIWIEPSGRKHVKPAAKLPTPKPVEPPVLDDADLGDPPF